VTVRGGLKLAGDVLESGLTLLLLLPLSSFDPEDAFLLFVSAILEMLLFNGFGMIELESCMVFGVFGGNLRHKYQAITTRQPLVYTLDFRK
jgi:hypothetical protein